MTAVTEIVPDSNIENNQLIKSKTLKELIKDISSYKQQSASSLLEIGLRLKRIKEEKLYEELSIANFRDFLKIPDVDLTSSMADKFMSIVDDEKLKENMYVGASKLVEVLKIEPEKRKKLFEEPIKVNGQEKAFDELSLSELKKVSQDIKRIGKMKCDRCGRWVEHLKEIDGKFYGSGAKESCYDREVEERRALEERAIPSGQLDNVLKSIREVELKDEEDNNTEMAWLPERIYQIYGQFLNEYNANSEELSVDSLKKEEEIINKLLNLLKNRFKDVKESIKLIGSSGITP